MNKHENELENNDSEMEEEHCNCDCDCNSDDISTKEIAYHADDKVDALIHLLIKKNVISESEFEEEYNSLFEESEEAEEETVKEE